MLWPFLDQEDRLAPASFTRGPGLAQPCQHSKFLGDVYRQDITMIDIQNSDGQPRAVTVCSGLFGGKGSAKDSLTRGGDRFQTVIAWSGAGWQKRLAALGSSGDSQTIRGSGIKKTLFSFHYPLLACNTWAV